MVAPVKIQDHRMLRSPWIPHACLPHEPDYSSITKAHVTSTKPVTQPNSVNKGITATSHLPRRIKETSKEFDLQEAVTNIGVQCIIASIKDK